MNPNCFLFLTVFMRYYDDPKGMIPAWLVNWASKVRFLKPIVSKKIEMTFIVLKCYQLLDSLEKKVKVIV